MLDGGVCDSIPVCRAREDGFLNNVVILTKPKEYRKPNKKFYFSEGKEGILNFIAETFEYTGGAHPNSWNKWMNFEKNTGKLLALKDVFMAGSEKPMSDMLLEELITEMATRLEDSSITSLEGLQNAGILNSTNMYVPDNFLLEKEKVSFLYNKYDIAPYAVGVITLSLPYTSVEKYMIH